MAASPVQARRAVARTNAVRWMHFKLQIPCFPSSLTPPVLNVNTPGKNLIVILSSLLNRNSV